MQQEQHDLNQKQSAVKPRHLRPADPVVAFVMAQTALCVLVCLAVVVLRLFGGELYSALRSDYQKRFGDTTSVHEVVDAISGKTKPSSPKQEGIQSVLAPVTPTDVVTNTDQFGDSQDDSLALTEQPLLMNTAVNSTNDMAVPVIGTVTSPFGYRIHPIYGTRLFHNGVDIGADTGTDIVAALSGRVEIATYNDSYGYYVMLDHGNDFRTVYAHCSELNVEEGQTVQKGDLIALVGSTGLSTGPHLHFEVRRGEYRINPQWLVDLE